MRPSPSTKNKCETEDIPDAFPLLHVFLLIGLSVTIFQCPTASAQSGSASENYPAIMEIAGYEAATVAVVQKIAAPLPHMYKKDAAGRLVCPKDNDKPQKSKKGKGIHMDMECCLDPDEIPNPHCYYPVEKYGKYLKNPPK